MHGQQGLGHTVAIVQQGLMVTSCDDGYREEGMRSKWRGRFLRSCYFYFILKTYIGKIRRDIQKNEHQTVIMNKECRKYMKKEKVKNDTNTLIQ